MKLTRKEYDFLTTFKNERFIIARNDNYTLKLFMSGTPDYFYDHITGLMYWRYVTNVDDGYNLDPNMFTFILPYDEEGREKFWTVKELLELEVEE